MRCLKLWTCLVHLTLFSLVPGGIFAAPALTTVQDTLYKADGTRFNGVANIEWNSFQASDASAVATSSVVVPIVDGVLRVRLVPTSNASAGAHYFVRYHADGKVQFTETWNVIPSATPVTLAAVRVANGTATGASTTPPLSFSIPDITGLSEELAARPVKGFAYSTDRILKSGPTGALETVQGSLSDCIRVDGSTGPCGSGSNSGGGPGFVDQETPTGAVNGSNTVFTLSQAPSPESSLQVYRNGILQRSGVDFALSGTTLTFAGLSVPQTGDLLTASYRLANGSSPSGLAAGALSGSFPAPQIAEGAISNFNIAAAAGIVESKLSLNYPTHSNANDPSAGEKAALSGTGGVPSATNKFVTDQDIRMTNARTPVAHPLLGTGHNDTTAGAVQRGDLIVGSFATGSARWTRLPLGGANRCLISNGSDAIWNTCLFAGFQAGAVPFTGTDGVLTQAPMYFAWDNSNRRLSVGSNLGASTLTVYDAASGGSTTLTVRGGHGQGSNLLQSWQNSAGIEQANIDPNGVFSIRSVEAVSTSLRPAWREQGAATDPSIRTSGDAWYNSTERTRKTVDGGQVHTTPQVLCSANGASSASTSVVSLGSCSIPAGVLNPGDRLAISATWSHTGTAAFVIRWKWGLGIVGSTTVPGTTALFNQNGEASLFDAGAILSGPSFIENNTQTYTSGLSFGFEGNTTAGGESLRLVQFTIVRYPAQANP